jgi:predicted DNA-binding protein
MRSQKQEVNMTEKKLDKLLWTRMSVSMVENLRRIADEEERTVASVIRQAVKEYLGKRHVKSSQEVL